MVSSTIEGLEVVECVTTLVDFCTQPQCKVSLSQFLLNHRVNQINQKVDAKVVKQVAGIVEDIETELTGNELAKLADMAGELTHAVTPGQVSSNRDHFLTS